LGGLPGFGGLQSKTNFITRGCESIVQSGVTEVTGWLLDPGERGIDGVNVRSQIATIVGSGSGRLLLATRSFFMA